MREMLRAQPEHVMRWLTLSLHSERKNEVEKFALLEICLFRTISKSKTWPVLPFILPVLGIPSGI